MKKVAYKFDSKHLGKAFMEELVEMGYYEGGTFASKNDCEGIRRDRKNPKEVCYTNFFDGISKHFQLETQWNEALTFAKEQIEPEFEVGDWVVCELPLMKKYAGKEERTYGFKWSGEWGDSIGYATPPKRKATKDEIEKALIKEAERRGFKKGQRVKTAHYENEMTVHKGGFHYEEDEDALYFGEGSPYGQAYYQGKWAEIVENNKFFDWDVEYEYGTVTIGCKTYTKEQLVLILDSLHNVAEHSVMNVIDELRKLDL